MRKAEEKREKKKVSPPKERQRNATHSFICGRRELRGIPE
jgi:hypothetical protein